MDVVQVSNVFNAMVQLHPDLKFYHGGLHEKINQNGIPNNFDPLNSVGKQYPLLWFPYEAITGVKNLSNQRQLEAMQVTLLFYDLMFYDNDSTNNTRTELEIVRDLDAIAIGFIAAIRKANKVEINGNVCNGLGVGSPVNYTYIPFQHNDRLMCIRYDFTLNFFSECQAFDPDFGLLPVDTPLPVEDYDYEDLGHKNDSP